MPNYRYRALTQSGEVVHGTISAPNAAEVARRIEFLSLVPIDSVVETASTERARGGLSPWSRARAEDVTIFTGDLALLLRTGARINDALELLSNEIDTGRLRPVVAQIQASVMAGESFADGIAHHPALFPAIYQALVRIGETSGTLDHILEAIGQERQRAEALKGRLADALRYPAFVLLAACGVLAFFLFVVLPQFASVLQDFNAKLDPMLVAFLWLSGFVRSNGAVLGLGLAASIGGCWLVLRRPGARAALIGQAARLPLLRPVVIFYRTALFCRNLGTLLSNGVTMTAALRILSEMMAATGDATAWNRTVDRVRQGGKLSEALSETTVLPAIAVRMLRLGEESGQLPMLAGRVADFYEAKLHRSLDRVVGVVGPLAIIVISIIVGGLIVSVMSALLSVSQIIG